MKKLLCAVALAAVVPACSGEPSPTANSTTTVPTTQPAASGPTLEPSPTTAAPSTGTSPSPTTTLAPALTTPVAVGLRSIAKAAAPTALVARTGTRNRYVAERAGRVRVLDTDNRLSTPILDISSDTTNESERGLLGLAFSPDGRLLYVSYTNSRGDTRVDEFTTNGDTVDTASRRNVLALSQPFSNHNGGNIVFGPDGLLWMGLGDGGSQNDPSNNGQNPDALLASILRFDPAPSGTAPRTIPNDNPFAAGGGAPEVWLKGVRNPWRFSFDAATGDLWIGDVGGSQREEIDWLPAPARGRGANLQWSQREGTLALKGAAPPGSIGPVFEYDHSDGACSIVGGYVYRGKAIPELAGTYLYTDYCRGRLEALAPSTGTARARQISTSPAKLSSPVSFGADADGELYVLSLGGEIYQIVPR